jgi:hypothetical protein
VLIAAGETVGTVSDMVVVLGCGSVVEINGVFVCWSLEKSNSKPVDGLPLPRRRTVCLIETILSGKARSEVVASSNLVPALSTHPPRQRTISQKCLKICPSKVDLISCFRSVNQCSG